jgi:outer membrane protein insertion porin family
VEATTELRFPLVSALSGCVFADWGSDLDSGASVIGDPAGAYERARGV